MFFNIFAVLFLLWLLDHIVTFTKHYLNYRALKAQGIPFISGYNILTDMMDFVAIRKQYPNSLPWMELQQKKLGTMALPPIVGKMIMGRPVLHINSCELLQDFFVNKNPWLTKSKFHAKMSFRTSKSIIITETQDEHYELKRKTLSGVFFKQSLQNMMRVIKECTLDNIGTLQAQGPEGSFDLVQYTLKLQTDIIVACVVGKEACNITVEVENLVNGSVEELRLPQIMFNMFNGM